MNRLKFEAIASSVLIYLIIIVTIFSIALYSPDKKEYKNFVDKKSEIIEVSLGSPVKSHNNINNKKNSNKKDKKSSKKDEQKHKKIKKVRNIHTKEPIKKRVPTKPKNTKTKTPKITHKKSSQKESTKTTHKKSIKKQTPKASSLFKNLPNSIKDDKPTVSNNQGKSGKSLKKLNQGKGIVDRYFAKVQSILKGWPAQSNFAGEKVRVELTIYPSGLFDYKILYRSLNPEFNKSLKAYLDQLKKVGFGPHSNPKPYKIIVEFIAKA